MNAKFLAQVGGSLALLSACGDSCRDKPYVPYSIDASSPPARSSTSTDGGAGPLAAGDAGASSVTPGATRWEVDGASVAAPVGTVFTAGVVVETEAGFEGIGVVRASGEGRRGSVVRVSRAVLSVIAENVHTLADASCSPVDRVASGGRGAAFVELSAACAGHESATAVSRYVALVRRGSVSWTAKLVDPSYAPRLKLDAESIDVDGDGAIDLRVTVAIDPIRSTKGEIAAAARAALVFVDRPSGLSLDTSEPEHSLSELAKRAVGRAAQKGDKLAAIATVRQVRALHQALCAEGGAPRLVGLPGRDRLACGESSALEAAVLAEARAHLEDRAPIAAMTTLAEKVPGARRDEGARKRLALELARLDVALASVKDVALVPELGPSPSPGLGALAFTREGELLVRSDGAVLRVDDSGALTKTDEPPWSKAFESPTKTERFVDVFADCEAFGAFVSFAPTKEGEPRDVPVALVPPSSRTCKAGRAPALAARALAWSDEGLVFVSEGRLVRVRENRADVLVSMPKLGGAPRGSGASPSATRWALATPRGIFVGGDKPVVYVSRELEPYDELRDCAVNDDGSRVACAKKDRVLVGRR